MTKSIKIQGLDGLYSALKSEAGKLSVAGWGVRETSYIFNSCNGTLLQWFLENFSSLKTGANNLLVATGIDCTKNNSYSTWGDTLHVSTTPTNSGLLVEITRTSNRYDNPSGWGRYSGGYELTSQEYNTIFLLKYGK